MAEKNLLIRVVRKAKSIIIPAEWTRKARIKNYLNAGSKPWSPGYHEYKEQFLKESISNSKLLDEIKNNSLPKAFAKGIDDRSVEYPWIFSNLSNQPAVMLDAGSTFNFQYLLEHPVITQKELTIFTYYPETPNFNEKKVSYVYGDLRSLPFKNNYFDEVVCQSTLEHIDMDNSMYGYDLAHESNKNKSYEYLKVITELVRVVKQGGMLLLTFPYGKFENHGFFQQFDREMLQRMFDVIGINAKPELTFFKYLADGWVISKQEECDDALSYNPHTGLGKGNDGAAHSRCICCIRYIKNPE
jgi:SAM-dependent methyltransferase